MNGFYMFSKDIDRQVSKVLRLIDVYNHKPNSIDWKWRDMDSILTPHSHSLYRSQRLPNHQQIRKECLEPQQESDWGFPPKSLPQQHLQRHWHRRFRLHKSFYLRLLPPTGPPRLPPRRRKCFAGKNCTDAGLVPGCWNTAFAPSHRFHHWFKLLTHKRSQRPTGMPLVKIGEEDG